MIYPRIYKAVHRVVRTLSIGVRKNYKRELRAVGEGADHNEMEMTQDNDHYDGKDADDTDDTNVKEDVILDEDEKYAQWEKEKMRAMMTIAVDQENQIKNTIKGVDAEPIELEDLLGLMKVCPQAPYIVISGMYTG